MTLFHKFGNNRIKQLKMSPDAYVQMAVQLSYFKDQNEFALTYESGLTRLFKFGRTETIRFVVKLMGSFNPHPWFKTWLVDPLFAKFNIYFTDL